MVQWGKVKGILREAGLSAAPTATFPSVPTPSPTSQEHHIPCWFALQGTEQWSLTDGTLKGSSVLYDCNAGGVSLGISFLPAAKTDSPSLLPSSHPRPSPFEIRVNIYSVFTSTGYCLSSRLLAWSLSPWTSCERQGKKKKECKNTTISSTECVTAKRGRQVQEV